MFWKLWSWITYRDSRRMCKTHVSQACVFCNRCLHFVIKSSHLTTYCFCNPLFKAIVWRVPYENKWTLQLHKDFRLFNGTKSSEPTVSVRTNMKTAAFIILGKRFMICGSLFLIQRTLKGDTGVFHILLVLIYIYSFRDRFCYILCATYTLWGLGWPSD
jgi:hypothetical protein